MSTGTRMEWREAVKAACSLRPKLDIPTDAALAWEVAGSVRRKSPTVGDIEIVATPATVTVVPEGAMFPQEVNALWHWLDKAVAAGRATRGHAWGEKYRAVIVDGVKFDIFLADDDNWGAILAIRTGPAEFSERCVTAMKARGIFRQQGGYVVYQRDGSRFPCGTEDRFFECCGMKYLPPEERR